ncbi:hypothetical protein KBTX_00631 [wastewater metagenome]|uniref:Uncharacterized protein n=2 Tax=unclassified sequences TaxID=12908 RepID=A0A5B8R8M9_9ZZZZ|nr:hypothetical protein KBTEX_00631 [uncultured organism]
MQVDGALLREIVQRLATGPVAAADLPGRPAETVAVHLHWLRNAGLATAPEATGRPSRLTALTDDGTALAPLAADGQRWEALVERLRRYPPHQVATALFTLARTH